MLIEKQASGRTLLAYVYDLSGNVVSRRDLTGKETCYGYDRCGRLKSVTDNGRVLAAYTYHGDGRVESRTIADTIRTDFRYDADKNLTYMKTVDMTAQGRKLVWEEYPAYDHNGNMVEKRNLEGTTRYAYDVNNQLVEVSYPGAGGLLSERFGYDKAGNRLTRERRTADSIIMETYHHDNCNRIKELNRRTYELDGVTPKLKKSPAVSINPDAVASYIGETSYYGYDRSGNLLNDGNATYTYDGFGRTAEVKMANGNSQINRYDAEGLRAEMEENGQLVQFLFNEEKEVIAEETSNDVIRYVRGLGIISSDSESARTYYHYVSDNQGSVRLILTDTANDRRIRNYYCYDAFGESVISHEDIHNRFRFNGEQYDTVTGQYYLRARFYNPVIGRFTQEDTYYGDGLNLYEYCRNNPVLYRDPSGHDICPAQIALYKQYRAAGLTPQKAYEKMCSDLGLSKPSPLKGYVPQIGERTLKGYVENNASPEIVLNTQSAGFNYNKGNVGGQFKRFGAESHGGISPHVHQPQRNVTPKGDIYGSVGSKTSNGGVTSPSAKDVKQLYEYLNNGKYH